MVVIAIYWLGRFNDSARKLGGTRKKVIDWLMVVRCVGEQHRTNDVTEVRRSHNFDFDLLRGIFLVMNFGTGDRRYFPSSKFLRNLTYIH